MNAVMATHASDLKRTEFGLIPAAWETRELGALDPFVTSGSRGWARYYSDLGSAFLRITNLSRDSIYVDLSDLKLVQLPSGTAEGSRTELQVGDLLISITADIGIIAYVDSSVPTPAYINQHIALVRFTLGRVDSKFLSYFLASERPQRAFRARTDQGAKAGMSLAGIKAIHAVFPPPAEQEAIAAALSDVDALLAKLAALIAKKRDLKQAAMHQLLTGKTRLRGFTGEWASKQLGGLGHFLKGRGIRKDEALSGQLACIRYGEIYTQHNDCVRAYYSWISKDVARTAVRLRRGDLLFAGSGETKEEIGKCAAFLDNVEAYAGGDIVILRPDRCDSAFMGYYLNTRPISAQKASRGQGDAVVHISAAALSTVEITLPPLNEQTAIAAVLSEMDSEIAALEARRNKTRALKQGMMQELLTGRIRLL